MMGAEGAARTVRRQSLALLLVPPALKGKPFGNEEEITPINTVLLYILDFLYDIAIYLMPPSSQHEIPCSKRRGARL